jgi:anti-sigma factor RsiW
LVESVTDWIEGVLDDADRLQVEEHLAVCSHCLVYVEQLRVSLVVLREAPRPAPPVSARRALLNAFRQGMPTADE